jgi:hypothetical protein
MGTNSAHRNLGAPAGVFGAPMHVVASNKNALPQSGSAFSDFKPSPSG